MNHFDFFDKLIFFDKLVRQEHTGTPDQFAQRLSIGRSTLYEMIDELRLRGVEIKYSRYRSTFYYRNDVFIDIRLTIKSLSDLNDLESRKYEGGCGVFSSVLFLGWNSGTFVPESIFCSAQCKLCHQNFY